MASKANNQQLLDELEQNIVICWWRADQLRPRQIIDPRDTDKSRYFAITEFNNCFMIRSPSLFFNCLRSDLPFSHAKAIAGRRKAWFLLGKSRILFAAKHKPNTIGRHCAWADNYLKAVICRSRVRLSANERKKNLHSMIRSFIYSLESLEQLPTCGFSRVSRYKTSLSYRLIWDELHQQNISWRTQRGRFGVSTESTQACVVCPLAVKYFHIVKHTACRTWEK